MNLGLEPVLEHHKMKATAESNSVDLWSASPLARHSNGAADKCAVEELKRAVHDGRSPQVQNPVNRGGIPQLVDTRAAAAVLSRSVNTLKRWRYQGVGPDYVVFQGRVRYDVAVLRDYIAKHTRVPSVRASMEETRGAL
jgi:hypothetical protein